MPARLLGLPAAMLLVAVITATAGRLHDAVRLGDEAQLTSLIAAGAPLEALDRRGDTPLVAASYSGQEGAVRQLLDAGARIDGRSDRGMTALHAASYRGHTGIVSLLLARGADIDDRGNRFRITPLHGAAEENHLEVVELLISNGATLDLREVNALTSLTQAGFREHWEIVETLRKAGARCQPMAMTGELLYKRCNAIEPR